MYKTVRLYIHVLFLMHNKFANQQPKSWLKDHVFTCVSNKNASNVFINYPALPIITAIQSFEDIIWLLLSNYILMYHLKTYTPVFFIFYKYVNNSLLSVLQIPDSTVICCKISRILVLRDCRFFRFFRFVNLSSFQNHFQYRVHFHNVIQIYSVLESDPNHSKSTYH